MLVVRNETFLRYEDRLYILGSSSNQLYDNNCYYMGSITLLGWVKEAALADVALPEQYHENADIKLSLYPAALSLRQKAKIIKEEVRRAEAVSIKLTITDAIIAGLYALRFKKPFVVESAGSAFDSLWSHGGSILYKIAAIPVELLIRWLHRKAKYIIYVSRHFLQKKYPSRARQIGCPDVVLSLPETDVLERRLDRIQHHDGPYILGLVGATQAEYRGHDTLIKAAKCLLDRGYDVRVAFLGGGTRDKQRMDCAQKYGVSDRIEFCGKLPHDRVGDWIDSIDVLVMPTLQETLGRAIIEAMSRGCPVVGSSETAIREQLGDDCIVSARDVSGIADVIENMISNIDYASACAKENFFRSFKYVSSYTNNIRKKFYSDFYRRELGR